jgi:hypothetical protein
MHHRVFIISLILKITMLYFSIVLKDFEASGIFFLAFCCLLLNLRLNFTCLTFLFFLRLRQIIGLIVFVTAGMLLLKLSHIDGLTIQYLLRHFLDLFFELTHGLLGPLPFFYDTLVSRFLYLFNNITLYCV